MTFVLRASTAAANSFSPLLSPLRKMAQDQCSLVSLCGNNIEIVVAKLASGSESGSRTLSGRNLNRLYSEQYDCLSDVCGHFPCSTVSKLWSLYRVDYSLLMFMSLSSGDS